MRNFTPEDFSGSGQYLVRIGSIALANREAGNKNWSHVPDTGYLSTVMYKVGYMHNNWSVDGTRGQLACLISMADGWTRFGSITSDAENEVHDQNTEYTKKLWVNDDESTAKQKLCDWLNDIDGQEFRFATQEEVVRVVMYQRSRWR